MHDTSDISDIISSLVILYRAWYNITEDYNTYHNFDRVRHHKFYNNFYAIFSPCTHVRCYKNFQRYIQNFWMTKRNFTDIFVWRAINLRNLLPQLSRGCNDRTRDNFIARFDRSKTPGNTIVCSRYIKNQTGSSRQEITTQMDKLYRGAENTGDAYQVSTSLPIRISFSLNHRAAPLLTSYLVRTAKIITPLLAAPLLLSHLSHPLVSCARRSRPGDSAIFISELAHRIRGFLKKKKRNKRQR